MQQSHYLLVNIPLLINIIKISLDAMFTAVFIAVLTLYPFNVVIFSSKGEDE